MSIINIIKHIIGHPEWVEPISDKYIYGDNKKSYSGNSLNESNILFVTNLDLQSEQMEYVKQAFAEEKAHYKNLRWNFRNISAEDIRKSGAELVGPYDHIINMVLFGDDEVVQVYKLLRAEMDYLIKYCEKGTLCTAIIKDNIKSAEINARVAGLASLLKGLGQVSANHGVIENGIIVNNSIDWKDIVPFLLYLSSKYGQILNGEVLELESWM